MQKAMIALGGAMLLGSFPGGAVIAQTQAPAGLNQIETIVVLYLENRSFDHLFGNFPGANGLANAGAAAIQVDANGKPYDVLPDPLDLRKKPPARYEKLPATLPNAPFKMNDSYKLGDQLGSLVHAYYQQQIQINGGLMNRFAEASDAKGYAMAYWDGSSLKMYDYAKKYTLADNFFHGAFGGSFLNHIWLVCACAPVYPNAPANIVAKVDPSGKLIEDGFVTPDGFGVNTMEPVGGPFGPDKEGAAPSRPDHGDHRRPLDREERVVDVVFRRLERGRQRAVEAGHAVQLPPSGFRVFRQVPEVQAGPRQAPQGSR